MRMRNVCQWGYLELDDEKEIDDIENIYDAANITVQDNVNDSMIEESIKQWKQDYLQSEEIKSSLGLGRSQIWQ